MKDNERRPQSRGIIVLDYGSQYTLLIARRLRELGIYSEVIDGASDFPPKNFEIDGIILSGGPDSVTESASRRLPKWVLLQKKPVLGICYGMGLLVDEFGGRFRSGAGREYGKTTLVFTSEMDAPAARVFYNLPTEQQVWMSHGDDLDTLPKDFSAVGHTDSQVVAAVVHNSLPIIGLQFHPEVQHSEHGATILKQFVKDLCKIKLNWQSQQMLDATADYIRTTVGPQGHVLMAVSGGVDSTVATVLLAKTLGPERVTAVFVDHGLLRKNEAAWVVENLRFLGVKNLQLLKREELFLSRLKGVSDPEQKRKIVGNTFIEVFEDFAKPHREFTHLGQGTLYPDVIESAGHGAGSKVIKSHHNVGGLPEKLHLQLIEPFRFLFKDEVRKIGSELGISEAIVQRHPFPGPGLAIRILGDVDAESVRLLQEADDIFIKELKSQGLYHEVWQAFAVLLPVKSVGVMGDNRTYEKTLALRAVSASDGMTAGVSNLPMEFLTRVADQIVRKVSGINRIVYDITTKPPATIEWE